VDDHVDMGRRTEQHTEQFIAKLDAATFGHFHLSSDDWKSYPHTIKKHLVHRVDHGDMRKIYGRPINYPISAPARIIGAYRSPRTATFISRTKYARATLKE
jgi:hypothetical protein